jgi:hypothetical protein
MSGLGAGGAGMGDACGRRAGWMRQGAVAYSPSGSEQSRAGQGRAGQGRAGQGRAGQGRAGQGRAGQGRAAERAQGLSGGRAGAPAQGQLLTGGGGLAGGGGGGEGMPLGKSLSGRMRMSAQFQNCEGGAQLGGWVSRRRPCATAGIRRVSRDPPTLGCLWGSCSPPHVRVVPAPPALARLLGIGPPLATGLHRVASGVDCWLPRGVARVASDPPPLCQKGWHAHQARGRR